MKVHLSRAPNGEIIVQARAEGRGLIGDLFQTIAPGQSFGSKSYAELVALGPGAYDWKVFEPIERKR